jgi:hypothetical protein
MFANLALMGGALLVGLAICEGLARLVAPQALVAFPVLYNGTYTYVPNQRQRFATAEWDYEIHINADGFRNDTLLADMPPGSMVFLGDSFIEGYGVALADTAAKKLERIRAEAGARGVVYNAAHNNTSPDVYVSVWEHYFARRPEIDTVIVGFFIGNDLIENIGSGRLLRALGEQYDASNTRDFLRLFLGSHSVLYNLINYTIKANRTVHNTCRRVGLCGAPHPDDIYLKEHVDPLLAPTTKLIAGFAEAVRAAGQRLLVVIIPAKDQVNDDGWRWIEAYYADRKPGRFYANDTIAAAFRARCVHTLDLTGPSVEHARAGGVPLYFRSDGHWSPAGHEFVARLIARELAAPSPPCTVTDNRP